jgi:hypothetical protein
MEMDTGVTEELVTAAAMYGPRSTEPPYVRAPFPMVALPPVLRRFVQEAAEALGVAPECVATTVLGTCAAAIGNTCRIRLKKSWTEPCVIWAITLMESGSLKSPAYHAAVEPLHAMQRLWVEQYEQAQKDFRKAKALYEAEAVGWKQTDGYRGESAPSEPLEPKPVDLFAHDTTVEALVGLLANNPRGVALTRDELSGFFSSFGAYKGGRGGDEAAYLEFYNAKPWKVNRAGGRRLYAHHTALSIYGTCQPAVFRNLIGLTGHGANQVENGLASRFLIAAPESRPQRWVDDKAFDPQPYHHLVAKLASIPMSQDADGRHQPADIDLSPEAAARFHPFVTEHGAYTETIENAPTRFHYRKLAGYAARLALIFYLCDAVTEPSAGPRVVQERHVLAGIAVVRWYGREAWRVYGGDASAADWDQRELLDAIRARGGVIALSDMRRLRRQYSDPRAAELALQDLARAGYGVLAMESTAGRPALRFRLHPQGEKTISPENPGISDASFAAVP